MRHISFRRNAYYFFRTLPNRLERPSPTSSIVQTTAMMTSATFLSFANRRNTIGLIRNRRKSFLLRGCMESRNFCGSAISSYFLRMSSPLRSWCSFQLRTLRKESRTPPTSVFYYNLPARGISLTGASPLRGTCAREIQRASWGTSFCLNSARVCDVTSAL